MQLAHLTRKATSGTCLYMGQIGEFQRRLEVLWCAILRNRPQPANLFRVSGVLSKYMCAGELSSVHLRISDQMVGRD